MKKTLVKQFIFELQILIATGINLLQAIELLSNSQQQLNMQRLLNHIKQSLLAGCSLSQALAKHQTIFNRQILQLIQQGEETGQLEQTLKAIHQQLEEKEKLRKQLQRALIYPGLLLSSTIIIAILLLTLVVPQFQDFYQGFNKQLPWITQCLIMLSDFLLAKSWLLLLGSCSLTTGLMLLYKKHLGFRKKFHRYLLRTPMIKLFFNTQLKQHLYALLALYLKADINIDQALAAAIQSCTNLDFQQQLQELRHSIQQGYSFSSSISPCQFASYSDKQLIHIGENAGKLANIFNKLARRYQKQLEQQSKTLTTLIEPMFLVLMGAMIGTVVIAIYLPIFNF